MEERFASEKDTSNGIDMLMYEYMSKVTLDIICETAFGYKCDSLRNPHNELAEAYDNLLNLQDGVNIARFMVLASLPGFKRFFNSEWAYNHRHWFSTFAFLAPGGIAIDSMHRIKKISAQMLEEKLADSAVAAADTAAKRDIMSLLVRARKAEMEQEKAGYAMSDQQMMDQVLTFLGAGHETTASGLAWVSNDGRLLVLGVGSLTAPFFLIQTLWLLANDKHSQNELRKEVKPIFDNDPRPDYRELKDLPWLDGVVMESLRLLPPVPMTWRQASRSEYIEGVLVPKGTLFYIPIRVVNTYKEIWGENAEEFYPPRWQNLPKNYTPTLSLLSFIAGPHACIGKTMAIMEMKAVVAALIAKFEFEPSYEGQIAHPTAAVTMKPKDNMPLRVKRII
ncbi:hypothetical protein HGRIS_005807 [Hohenbuehelia grisea]|uniref:Cytochrome P450 n=1 Tax=Hohenbuehelia grisea TaxID=104357 RepID=A0ABR3JZ13_9AGAR